MAYVHERRGIDPAGLAAAVAINGGVIAALLLAAPEVIRKITKPLPTITIVTPTKPDPIKEQPREAKAEQPARRQSLKPVIDTQDPIDRDPTLIADPGPIEPGSGEGPAGTIDPPQPHNPVLAGSRIDPLYAGALQPPYPPAMQRLGIEGVAVVRVLIGIDGRVKAVELVRADDTAFFEATRRQALSRWRFVPATRDGVAIESWREMIVRFEIARKDA